MNSFEDLENIWGGQKEISPKQAAMEVIEKAGKDSGRIKKKFLYTILILGITCLSLAGYMVVYKTYTVRLLFVCNSVMIGLLLIRIGLEWESYRTLNRLSFSTNTHQLVMQTERFYARRKYVNFILSPLIFLAYWGVFYFLEAPFKEALSPAMYNYIMVSGMVIFIALAVIIFRSIRQEMAILDKMRNYLSHLQG